MSTISVLKQRRRLLDATIGELRNPTPRKTPAVNQRHMSDWQPIDTAPRDGTIILCALDFLPYPLPLSWAKHRALWFCPADGQPHNPTHWMPLPKAPDPEGRLKAWMAKNEAAGKAQAAAKALEPQREDMD
jgi:hypothetical protein